MYQNYVEGVFKQIAILDPLSLSLARTRVRSKNLHFFKLPGGINAGPGTTL